MTFSYTTLTFRSRVSHLTEELTRLRQFDYPCAAVPQGSGGAGVRLYLNYLADNHKRNSYLVKRIKIIYAC